MWKAIKDIIHQYHHFVITTHVYPDGDGIGAASALADLLIQQKKNAKVVYDAPIPQKFQFLNFKQNHEVYDPTKDWSWVEVVVVLDTHHRERIGRLSALLDQPNVVAVCIDHHTITSVPFTPHTVIHPQSCSVGAMVYTLIKESGYPLTLEAATGVYTSIVCDTGRFSYPSTTRKAHKIADECIKMGVSPDRVHRAIYQQVPLEQMQAFAKALQGLEVHFDQRLVFQVLQHTDYPGHDELEHLDLEYVHEFLKQILNVECAILFRVLPEGMIRISSRSKTFVDVGLLMKSLGGGGHARAAGSGWKGSIEEAKTKILALLKDVFDLHEPSQLAKSRCQSQSIGII